MGLLLLAAAARADEPSEIPEERLEEIRRLSLEELLNLPVKVATRTEVGASQTPSAVYVVTDEQIRERGYRTLMDVLSDLPGFDIIHTNGIYPDLVHQRGLPGNNQRTLLYINGVLDNNIFEQAILGQSVRFPLAEVKRIEVLAGPASALYGPNAFNGVINIVTKDGVNDRGSDAGVQGGFYFKNQPGGGAAVGTRGSFGRQHPFAYAVSGYVYRTDGPSFAGVQSLDPNTGRGYYWSPLYDNSQEYTYNVSARFSWRNLRVETVNWDYRQGQGTFGNGNQQVDTDRNGNVGSAWDFRSNTVVIGYLARLRPSLSLDSELNGRHTELLPSSHDAYRNNPDSGPAYARPDDLVYEDRWTREDWSLELKEKLLWEPGPKLSTMVGAEGIYINVPYDYARFNPQALRRNYGNIGVYVEAIYKPTRRISITGGFRYDYSTLYGSSYTPRLSAVFVPVENLTLKALFGTGFRGPTAWEVYSTTATRVPNPGLTPERMISGELGASYLLLKRFAVGMEAYFNQIYGLIVDDVPTTMERAPGKFYNQNRNAGDAQIVGIEATTELRFSRQVRVNANYTFNWGRYNNLQGTLVSSVPVLDSDRIPNIARHHLNGGVTVYPYRTLSLNLRFNWVGDRETIATNPLRTVGGYFLVNANLRWMDAFTVRGLYVDLLVKNLLNTSAFDPGIRIANGDYYPTKHPIDPLNLWLTLGYEF
jgi:iron complex outermembrane receptor protein